MDARFDGLKAFYTRLAEAMPSSKGLPATRRAPTDNVCGDCFECCKFHLMLTKHEFDCIEAFLTERDGCCPIQWVTCTTPLQDARLRQPVDPSAHCPLFEPGRGCKAYEVRPLACRMFGPFHPKGTPLPAPCVFLESEEIASVQRIPLWDEYAEVVRRNKPSPPGYFTARPSAPDKC